MVLIVCKIIHKTSIMFVKEGYFMNMLKILLFYIIINGWKTEF